MSKPKVFCTQCVCYRGQGWTLTRKLERNKFMERCWRGCYLTDYVLSEKTPDYDDCDQMNKWGTCKFWKPNLAIRLLAWRPRWLGGMDL